MATQSWQVSGQYYETCSCDFVCTCILNQMATEPTHGSCTFAMAFSIEQGSFGNVPLDGLAFIVVGLTPGAMGKGNWSVGVIADDRATAEQRDAIAAIASGAHGGPMSALAGLVGTFLGVESAPIRIAENGVSWSATAGSLVDMAAQGAMGVNPESTEPMQLTNSGHPANDRLGLYRALKSHVHALGVSWDDTSGRNNGHHAPFAWRSA
jgi:hypothetical protein